MDEHWSEFHRRAPRMSVAVGAVVRRGGRVLIVRQTYGWMKGQWGLPTGFVDRGERPDAAAVREVREEAGIVAALEGLAGIALVDWEGDPQLYLAFRCRHVEGEPVPDGVENDRATFLSPAEMDAFEEPIEPLCARFARQVPADPRRALLAGVSELGSPYLAVFD